MKKLHHLSALIPPEEGTEKHAKLTHEIEEMVRLVEAVKLVDTSSVVLAEGESVPDGRIWEEGAGIDLKSNTREVEFESGEGENGTELLKHALRTENGFYTVEHDRRRK